MKRSWWFCLKKAKGHTKLQLKTQRANAKPDKHAKLPAPISAHWAPSEQAVNMVEPYFKASYPRD